MAGHRRSIEWNGSSHGREMHLPPYPRVCVRAFGFYFYLPVDVQARVCATYTPKSERHIAFCEWRCCARVHFRHQTEATFFASRFQHNIFFLRLFRFILSISHFFFLLHFAGDALVVMLFVSTRSSCKRVDRYFLFFSSLLLLLFWLSVFFVYLRHKMTTGWWWWRRRRRRRQWNARLRKTINQIHANTTERETATKTIK